MQCVRSKKYALATWFPSNSSPLKRTTGNDWNNSRAVLTTWAWWPRSLFVPLREASTRSYVVTIEPTPWGNWGETPYLRMWGRTCQMMKHWDCSMTATWISNRSPTGTTRRRSKRSSIPSRWLRRTPSRANALIYLKRRIPQLMGRLLSKVDTSPKRSLGGIPREIEWPAVWELPPLPLASTGASSSSRMILLKS